jgi:DNA-binding transcriptional MocR family regulator
MPATAAPSRNRYELLADEIGASIDAGVLRVGDRLPSVRQASASRGVSPSTVFQAYYLLEARGVVRARDRSGYYVCAGSQSLPPEPESITHTDESSVTVSIQDRIFEVLESSMQRDLVPFGSAFPSPLLFPLERLAKAMRTATREIDPWSSIDDLTPGSARLRRQIALRYLSDGLHVHADDIVITNGALEALNLCLMAVTRPSDAVVVESPTFYAALQALERNGLKAIEVPTHPREGIDLAALARVLERHSPKACWLMTNFQNPLGSLMPDAKKRDLVALLSRYEVPLIEDDVYGELHFGARRPSPAKAFDQKGLVMHCSSFSKCLAPGYRIGWAAPGRFARKVARLKLTTSLATSAPTQAAIASYLEAGGYDRHLRHLRHALSLQQGEMMRAVARHFPQGTRATRPAGGYFVWIELPEHVDALDVHRHALSHGISVAPGPIFSSHARFRNCLRLNYGHEWNAQTEAAIATLGRLVSAWRAP